MSKKDNRLTNSNKRKASEVIGIVKKNITKGIVVSEEKTAIILSLKGFDISERLEIKNAYAKGELDSFDVLTEVDSAVQNLNYQKQTIIQNYADVFNEFARDIQEQTLDFFNEKLREFDLENQYNLQQLENRNFKIINQFMILEFNVDLFKREYLKENELSSDFSILDLNYLKDNILEQFQEKIETEFDNKYDTLIRAANQRIITYVKDFQYFKGEKTKTDFEINYDPKNHSKIKVELYLKVPKKIENTKSKDYFRKEYLVSNLSFNTFKQDFKTDHLELIEKAEIFDEMLVENAKYNKEQSKIIKQEELEREEFLNEIKEYIKSFKLKFKNGNGAKLEFKDNEIDLILVFDGKELIENNINLDDFEDFESSKFEINSSLNDLNYQSEQILNFVKYRELSISEFETEINNINNKRLVSLNNLNLRLRSINIDLDFNYLNKDVKVELEISYNTKKEENINETKLVLLESLDNLIIDANTFPNIIRNTLESW
ncbi:hypothetical protein [Vagococcus fluvialis]|uniref:hypothetical protein n=1 Tax=Vagococcus fluvialis TaxID=2738 RepID=UPI001D0A26B7|nr:hypothetical protein [Vagococcus fluvialis]UDM84075.1 hypothetical protein K5K96_15290 [Vagococcus fluvialis]